MKPEQREFMRHTIALMIRYDVGLDVDQESIDAASVDVMSLLDLAGLLNRQEPTPQATNAEALHGR